MAWDFSRGGYELDRLTRKLGHHKQTKFKEFKHKPLDNEGYDGDMGAYQADGGIVFCVKAFSKWWELTSNEELDKSGKIGKWINMDLLTNWSNYDTSEYMSAGYMLDSSGMVHLRGTITNDTDRDEHICVLPPIYRPHRSAYGIALYQHDVIKRLYISNRSGMGYGLGHIFLPDGSGSGWVSIDNISWWVGKERLRQL